MPRCNYCGATIRFVPTQKSNGTRRMPIDAEPNDDGNVELVYSETRLQTEAVVHSDQMTLLEEQTGQAGQRYMPHFATCPNWKENNDG